MRPSRFAAERESVTTIDDAFTDAMEQIETILAFDPGARGIGDLVVRGSLERAATSLLGASRVGIVTGYYVPQAGAAEADGSKGACETDGPPGAWSIGDALTELGIAIRYYTDGRCAGPMAAAGMKPLVVDGNDESVRDLSHLISIERSGRAVDGRYYNSRAMDRTATTGDLDRWFLHKQVRYTTIGIGDGGNEIGMGKIYDRVARSRTIPNAPTVASMVPTDYLIVTGVSNWGGWGLAAALSILSGRSLLPTPARAERQLARVVEGGAFDGIRGIGHGTVDNIEWDVHLDVLAQLQQVVSTILEREYS